MARLKFSEVAEWMERNGLGPAKAARIFGVSSQRFNGWSARGQVSADFSDTATRLMSEHEQKTKGVLPPYSDQIMIPQLAVAGAMGSGAYPPEHIDVVQQISARVSELRKQCTFSDPRKLQIITGYGRSMMPTFSDGDALLIDTGISVVDVDAVYAFTFDKCFYIKGLQRMPRNGLRVISHNRDENEAWEIKTEELPELIIHGRVILAWNARRL